MPKIVLSEQERDRFISFCRQEGERLADLAGAVERSLPAMKSHEATFIALEVGSESEAYIQIAGILATRRDRFFEGCEDE